MQSYVLLLRGINVGGRNRLPMNDLKAMLRESGYLDVNHYIQSGNVVVRAPKQDHRELEMSIEASIKKRFRLTVPAMVLPAERFLSAVSGFPFESGRAEKSVFVFLAGEGSGEWADQAQDRTGESDKYERRDDVAYLYCPNGLSKSKAAELLLSAPKPPIKATMRNWRTVNRILGLITEISESN